MFGYCLIFFVCILIYSNTFKSSWQLDDFPNIVENPLIRISDFSINSLLRASNLLHDQNNFYSGISYRPAAFLSFAVNWYFGKDQVTGYHVVNISIHILCSALLYFLLLSLFKSPNLKNIFHNDDNEKNAALLAAILWAVHPIQTQAVTYIVQRMALLAAFFYLLGIICYVDARTNRVDLRYLILLYAGCLCCFILGVLSKENVLLLPISLGLIEIIFFQDLTISVKRKRYFNIAAVIFTATLLLIILFSFILKIDLMTFINKGVEGRYFTLTERILTQPRIVIGYLIQIFHPVLSRFSIDHSITLSTSLFEPITTIGSILLIIGFIILAILRIQKSPILSFAILFYFVNHIMESSIIPLELIFEHRNYLPSMFIFFPFAAGAIQIMRYYRNAHRPFIFIFSYSLITVLIIVIGVTTYLRNDVWTSEKTLWENALLKAADSARPYGRLAVYYEREGNYDLALKFYETSLTKQWSRYSIKSVTLFSMANIYVLKQDYLKAIKLYEESFSINSKDLRPIFNKANLFITMNRWDKAEETVKFLLEQKYIPWEDFYLMGLILLKKNDPVQALDYFRRANRRFPNNPKAYVGIGISLSIMGHYKKADWFFSQAAQLLPGDIILLLCSMDNHLKAGNMESLQISVNTLFRQHTISYIQDTLRQISQEEIYLPIDSKSISSLIAKQLQNVL